MEAISYIFKFQRDFNRPGCRIINEIYIPSKNIIVNYYDNTLNVFKEDKPRINNEGMARITWNTEVLNNPRVQERIKQQEEDEKQFNYDKQIKNIILPIALVDKLVMIAEVNESKKQLIDEIKTYL